MDIKLSKKIAINGTEVDKVNLDFNKITGNELLQAESLARAKGDVTPTVFLSMNYQAIVAAKLIGMQTDEFMKLPAEDFKKIVVPVANFLLG